MATCNENIKQPCYYQASLSSYINESVIIYRLKLHYLELLLDSLKILRSLKFEGHHNVIEAKIKCFQIELFVFPFTSFIVSIHIQKPELKNLNYL